MDRTTIRDRVVLDFLERYLHDRESGNNHPLEHYLAAYPGFEGDITAQYQRAKADSLPPTEDDSVPPAGLDSSRIAHFKVLSELGRGGQGVVHLAEDLRLHRRVALKVLPRGVAFADDQFLRFRREAEIASRLDHPGICTIYETGQFESVSYIAMRYVEGATLRARVRHRGDELPDQEEVRRLARLMAKAAAAAHAAHEAGILHRDLKPANIIVTKDGEPVILDFGLARDLEADGDSLTRSGAVFGTPAYMSPEQIRGESATLDRRSDVYALGTTLYFSLSGHLPHDGPTFASIRESVLAGPATDVRIHHQGIPKDLAIVLATALEHDRNHRYASALAFAEDLERFVERRPIRATPTSAITKFLRFARREPLLTSTLTLLFLALLVAFSVTLHLLSKEREFKENLILADDTVVNGLLEEERALYPVSPALTAKAKGWLARATEQLGEPSERQQKEFDRLSAEMKSGGVIAPETRILFARVEKLARAHELLRNRVPLVQERIARSESIVKRSLEDPAEDWKGCIAAIRDSDPYDGLELQPELGLVPLGLNLTTKLYEFWHCESGDRPSVDPHSRRWVVTESSGLIFVLLPGGYFRMGAQHPEEHEQSTELPAHDVKLSPFFISKYEMTQAQWMRVHEGHNPSYYFPGTTRGTSYDKQEITLNNPVEYVSWQDALTSCQRLSLQLPTEAQWEYACRAGRETQWHFGDSEAVVAEYANLGGLEIPFDRHFVFDPPETSDPFGRHAPVGSFKPNRFGLHDMHGNVREPCADIWVPHYQGIVHRAKDGLRLHEEQHPRYAYRGGSYWYYASWARSAARIMNDTTELARDHGLRPVKNLDSKK